MILVKDLLKKNYFYRIYRERKNKEFEEKSRAANEAFKKEALEVLRRYSEALLSNNLVFWLDFGTLLGYYREHDFIKHDFDLDTGTWFENQQHIKDALEKAGFERVRHYYLKNGDGLEESYKHRDYSTTIDVFYYLNEGDKTYCYSFCPLVSMEKKRHLNKVQKSIARKWTHTEIIPVLTEFKGIKVFVPENTEAHIVSTYGEGFMTPIPNFPVKGRPNLTEYTYEEMPACAYLKIGYF